MGHNRRDGKQQGKQEKGQFNWPRVRNIAEVVFDLAESFLSLSFLVWALLCCVADAFVFDARGQQGIAKGQYQDIEEFERNRKRHNPNDPKYEASV